MKQKEQKLNSQAAINIYAILDNEMARMHALLQTYMTLPKEDSYRTNYGGLSSATSFSSHGGMPQIYKRIIDMQDLMLKALVAHDEIIQDKVAELALMGTADSETKEK
jgi:hypothetical protein